MLNKHNEPNGMNGQCDTSIQVLGRRGIIAFLLVAVGAMIYIIFRRDIIFINAFIPQHEGIYSSFAAAHVSHPFWHFLFFCLPDALWYAALLLIQQPLRHLGTLNTILYYTSVALPIALELAQAVHLLPGTYDTYDILTYLFTYLIVTQCLTRKHF